MRRYLHWFAVYRQFWLRTLGNFVSGIFYPCLIPIAFAFSLLGLFFPKLNRIVFGFSSHSRWRETFHFLHTWGTWLIYVAGPTAASLLVYGLLGLGTTWGNAEAKSDVVVIMAVTIGTSFAFFGFLVNQLPRVLPPSIYVEWALADKERNLVYSPTSSTTASIRVTNLGTITYENIQVEVTGPREVQPRMKKDTVPVLNRAASRELALIFDGHTSKETRFPITLRITTSTTFGAAHYALYACQG